MTDIIIAIKNLYILFTFQLKLVIMTWIQFPTLLVVKVS